MLLAQDKNSRSGRKKTRPDFTLFWQNINKEKNQFKGETATMVYTETQEEVTCTDVYILCRTAALLSAEHSSQWCAGRDLNPHGLLHTPLKRMCLPFHHPRKSKNKIYFYTTSAYLWQAYLVHSPQTTDHPEGILGTGSPQSGKGK